LLDEEINLTTAENPKLNQEKWTEDLILKEYKAQQTTERGFRFLKRSSLFCFTGFS
jgi:transposase